MDGFMDHKVGFGINTNDKFQKEIVTLIFSKPLKIISPLNILKYFLSVCSSKALL